jgi:hypothetical protein
MASGTLAQSALTAATNTLVYTVPVGKVASININFTNRSIVSAWVRMAVSTSTSPTTAEWILYDVMVGQYGTLEKTGLVMSASKQLICFADTGNISVNVYGYED